jgi:predicted enzyme related to lactoylglutathione lyase
VDIKLELVMVPVTDVDRAKAFYEQVGFTTGHDHTVSAGVRFVQLTPPGSGCSIAIGNGLTRMAPGSLDNLQVVVADIQEARDALAGRGIEVTDIEDLPWGSFVHFQDPDGNAWHVQAVTPRSAG